MYYLMDSDGRDLQNVEQTDIDTVRLGFEGSGSPSSVLVRRHSTKTKDAEENSRIPGRLEDFRCSPIPLQHLFGNCENAPATRSLQLRIS